MSTIGERIKQLRTKSGLSLQELAELVGKSKGNISGYENDKYEPSAQTIISLAKYFGVSTDWLLNGVEFNGIDVLDKHDSTTAEMLNDDIVKIFGLLDERDKEDVIESIKSKYARTIKRRENAHSNNIDIINIENDVGGTEEKNSDIA